MGIYLYGDGHTRTGNELAGCCRNPRSVRDEMGVSAGPERRVEQSEIDTNSHKGVLCEKMTAALIYWIRGRKVDRHEG